MIDAYPDKFSVYPGESITFSINNSTSDYICKIYRCGKTWNELLVFTSPFRARPGGGAGGFPKNKDDSGKESDKDMHDTPFACRIHLFPYRHQFKHWDEPFIKWFENTGYTADYCTDYDIHAEPDLLSSHRLLVSVGHDEYWTAEMRANVAAFVERGGNVAFFSGNVCWWRIHLFDANMNPIQPGTSVNPPVFMTVDKSWQGSSQYVSIDSPEAQRCDLWYVLAYQWRRGSTQVEAHPENTLTGVSLRNGGYGPSNNGYRVFQQNHWVFANTRAFLI